MCTAEVRSAYIHVPFCRHRCPYCNFTVVAGRNDLQATFVNAIERELSGLGRSHEVDTLFFGGGTPTELPPHLMHELFAAVNHWLPTSDNAEISVEANPEDITEDVIKLLVDNRVNRLSLGAQSFNDNKLRVLERSHSGNDIERAFELARRRIDNISLDLIFAAPSEVLSDWHDDLNRVLELEPDHISTYGLTYERGTRFWSQLQKQQLAEVDEALQRDMYQLAIDTLTGAGFTHYEVSNFSKPGRQCRHNLVYWSGGNYFAAGPGAARHMNGRREINHRSTTTYLKRVLAGESPVAESEELDTEARARERLVFGLRRLAGVDLTESAWQVGYDPQRLCGEPIQRYIRQGLLTIEKNKLRLTRNGLLVSDSMWPDFLSD